MSDKQKEKFRKEISDKFIHILQQDPLHWTRGWQTAGMDTPRNGISNHEYSGINWLSLSLTSIIKGYKDPRWLTMRQIADPDKTIHPDLQWHLKKGSHGEMVEYWFPFDTETKKSIDWQEYRKFILNGDRKADDFIIFPKYYYVFNAGLVEGIPSLEEGMILHSDIHPDDLVSKLSESMKVPIFYDGGDSAYYSSLKDEIHLPRPDRFNSQEELSLTTLHELGHSTGNAARLDRNQSGFFGSEDYAQEELIAELTSIYMSRNLKDINTDISCFNLYENNMAYVQSWIQAIQDKPEALVKAVKEATHASDYLEYKAGIIKQEEYEHKYGKDDIGLKHEQAKKELSRIDHLERSSYVEEHAQMPAQSFIRYQDRTISESHSHRINRYR